GEPMVFGAELQEECREGFEGNLGYAAWVREEGGEVRGGRNWGYQVHRGLHAVPSANNPSRSRASGSPSSASMRNCRSSRSRQPGVHVGKGQHRTDTAQTEPAAFASRGPVPHLGKRLVPAERAGPIGHTVRPAIVGRSGGTGRGRAERGQDRAPLLPRAARTQREPDRRHGRLRQLDKRNDLLGAHGSSSAPGGV